MIEPLIRPQNWAIPGPGAKKGTALIFGQQLGEKGCIRAFEWLQREGNRLFKKAGYSEDQIPTLGFNEPGLTAIDHEHALCEFLKYVRIEAGEGKGKKYKSPNPEPVTRELPQGWKRIHPVFNEVLLTPYHEPSYPSQRHRLPPPPVVIGDEPEWEVEEILEAKANRRGTVTYLVKFKGYPEPEWLQPQNLYNALEVVADFYKRVPNAPKPKDQQVKKRLHIKLLVNKPSQLIDETDLQSGRLP